jgi:hypothetical protein
MKATTTLRRAVCIGATVLALTAAGGCRGAPHAVPPRPTPVPARPWKGPSPDQLKTVADAFCKANEERTGNDSPYC